jgi:ABC-type uncharacterized transport system permease subunit
MDENDWANWLYSSVKIIRLWAHYLYKNNNKKLQTPTSRRSRVSERKLVRELNILVSQRSSLLYSFFSFLSHIISYIWHIRYTYMYHLFLLFLSPLVFPTILLSLCCSRIYPSRHVYFRSVLDFFRTRLPNYSKHWLTIS